MAWEARFPSFTLYWDFADHGSSRETLIKHGDNVIFAEPALYEGYERFIQVAEISRSRYGAALRDLIPTTASELYLYGDCSPSHAILAEARKRIFSISTAKQTLKSAEQDQTRPATLADIDALIAQSPSPQFVAGCKSLREQFQPGDEILEYCTSSASWQAMMGRAGYLLRRDGKDIAMIITKMN